VPGWAANRNGRKPGSSSAIPAEIFQRFWDTPLRSLSGEASWFGMYLSFVFPWLMSYYFTASKTYKYYYLVIIIYALILTFLTYSRTAYFIIAFQIIAFILII
jgi:hypothetical protein